ncbi:MAG: hypothetical protein HY260_04670 [Chloroflexi bacterium]|nr:hypothetical protein [Chloroflexota bacterium]
MLLDQTGLGEIALSPIGWSPQMILFRGLIPFTDQHRGLWASRPDGSEVRQIAVEEDFVGLPQFSPEGDRLALPVSDLSALPAGYGAGEPPANIIRILDLRDGHQAVIGPSVARQTVAGLEWTSDGLAALVGKWDADRAISAYRSAVVWSPAADGGGERVLLSTGASELSHLAACPDGSWLVAIQSGGDAQIVRADEKSLTTIAVRHGPALDWLACWQ